jgi:hypothetical protein
MGEREEIARIIDPEAFTLRNIHLSQAETYRQAGPEYTADAENCERKAALVIEPALAKADAILSRSGWRDISTCPKGEEPFLVIGGIVAREIGGSHPCVTATKVVTSDGAYFSVEDTDYYEVNVVAPTLWQPLPEPPKPQTEGG